MAALVLMAGAIKVTCAEIGNCSTKTPDLSHAFANAANTLIVLVGMLAVIFIIVSGLQMVVSNGDPKRYQQGRDSLVYSVVGVILAIAAYAIVAFISGAF